MTGYDNSKTKKYIDVIRDYIIEPLEKADGLSKSCFAAAMLIFAAIDGLGALIHSNANASNRERFEEFVGWLGDEYKRHASRLWQLRNHLMHSALNVASFMSCVEQTRECHLQDAQDGYLFIHTGQLLEDFKAAVNKLEDCLRKCSTRFETAEQRLEECSINDTTGNGGNAGLATTPPPVQPRKHKHQYVRVKRDSQQMGQSP